MTPSIKDAYNEENEERVSLLPSESSEISEGNDNAATKTNDVGKRRLYPKVFTALLMPLSLLGLAFIMMYVSMNKKQDSSFQTPKSIVPSKANNATMTITTSLDIPVWKGLSKRMKRRRHPPPLENLVMRNKILPNANVDWMLDFALIGFPKCGTSFLRDWLTSDESEIYTDEDEIYAMGNNKIGKMVQHWHHVLQNLLEDNKDPSKIKIGIKNPGDVDSVPSLKLYAKYFPSTRFIVQLRHPVLWFQSFYNFRVRNQIHRKGKNLMPPPSTLIGSCIFGHGNNSSYCCSGVVPCHNGDNVCTHRTRYHHAISRLGLTPLSSEREWDLLDHHKMTIHPVMQPVFFIEVNQLSVQKHPQRTEQLRQDLQAFLNVSQLPPVPTYHQPYERVPHAEIDICQAEYKPIRKALVQNGIRASTWIKEYLLESPMAIVSSREYFLELLETWKQDPCEQT